MHGLREAAGQPPPQRIKSTMDKKGIFLILLLCGSVSAMQNAYMRIDGVGVEYCLATDTIDTAVCNNTQYLALDGTQDHQIYLLPASELAANATISQKMGYFALTPLNLVISASALFIALTVAVILTYFFLQGAGVIK